MSAWGCVGNLARTYWKNLAVKQAAMNVAIGAKYGAGISGGMVAKGIGGARGAASGLGSWMWGSRNNIQRWTRTGTVAAAGMYMGSAASTSSRRRRGRYGAM